MITQIASNSIREGRSWSRLPTFSKQWTNLIRGSADFFGLNYYTSRYVEMSEEPTGVNPSYVNDIHLTTTIKPEWKHSTSFWHYSVPTGLGDILRFVQISTIEDKLYRRVLQNSWLTAFKFWKWDIFRIHETIQSNWNIYCQIRWIKKEYNNPEVFITENGWSDAAELEDNGRIEYLHDHLQQIQDVVLKKECNLKGYAGKITRNRLQSRTFRSWIYFPVWSIIDNFEWTSGYT